MSSFIYNPDDFLTEDSIEYSIKASEKMDCCPTCLSDYSLCLDPVSGTICTKCSTVVKSFINNKHNFATTDDNNGVGYSRCGGPVNPFLDRSNGSITVGMGNKRAEKVQRWTALDYSQHTIWKVFQEMKNIANKNNIPTLVLVEAKILYKSLKSKEIITRGLPKRALEATCFFKACSIHKLGRTHKEIAQMFEVPVSYMTEAINKFNNQMRNTNHKNLQSAGIESVPSYIERYCDLLLMNSRHVKLATLIANNTVLLGILCASIPTSVAVASVYFMIQHYNIKLPIADILKRLKQNNIPIDETKILKRKKTSNKALLSELTQQSDVTISKTYKKMQPWSNIITGNVNLKHSLEITVSDIVPKFV